ncbi:hypothetical protein NQ317_010468 [Molorchus minor]|uniref:Uncharacterized protein n=1 Tax=Molorchus minor TaxID=1323400 RepID=A0ABQ9K1I7_9CUCU|nr:hypothetical protein NQ317_010468 [Molorchus minor]
MVMEYPLQDFDCDQETDFLLGHSSRHGSDMDVHTAKTNRNPKRRRSLASALCRHGVFIPAFNYVGRNMLALLVVSFII